MSHFPYPFQAGVLRWLYIDFNSYFASVEQELKSCLARQAGGGAAGGYGSYLCDCCQL